MKPPARLARAATRIGRLVLALSPPARLASAATRIARLALAVSLLALCLAATRVAADAGPGVGEGRLAHILERGRLIVGVKIDYPPWGMVARDGRIVGLEPDLARDIADRLGVGLDLVPVTAGNRLQRLAQGRVDLVIATLGDTPARRTMAGLVRPAYYASGVGLLAPDHAAPGGWEALRGRPVCLNEGAFFNRALAERHGIVPVTFPASRDALQALRDGRCAGWAYDDTVIGRLLADPAWSGYRMAMPAILGTPWTIAVRKDEEDAALGRLVSDIVADWHRSGRLAALQARWGLPPSAFLTEAHARWSRTAGGLPVCRRGPDGAWPADCLGATEAPAAAAPPGRLPRLDALDRGRLVRGLAVTAALSLAAVAGALATGIALAWADLRLGASPGARLLRLPVRGLVALARMTPPILQLYIVFFGVGGVLAARWGWAPGGFLVAAAVLSLYAGATCAVLIRGALEQIERGTPPRRRILAALERCYDGLVATLVNIVKAVALASTIAVPEVVSAVNAILADGAPPAPLMTLLLVLYYFYVLAVLAALRAGRGAIARLR